MLMMLGCRVRALSLHVAGRADDDDDDDAKVYMNGMNRFVS